MVVDASTMPADHVEVVVGVGDLPASGVVDPEM